MKIGQVIAELGRPVSYFPSLALALGDVEAAVLVCQLCYWLGKGENPAMVYKTADQLTDETGLTYRAQLRARKLLRGIGLLSERRDRIRHTTFYTLDTDALEKLFEEWRKAGSPHRRLRPTQAEKVQAIPRVPKGQPKAGKWLPKTGGGIAVKRRSGLPLNGGRDRRKTVVGTAVKRPSSYIDSTKTTSKTTAQNPPVPPEGGGAPSRSSRLAACAAQLDFSSEEPREERIEKKRKLLAEQERQLLSAGATA